MRKNKKVLIGKKYKEVFGVKADTPGKYRALIKRYKAALGRLLEDSYKTKSLKTHDEKLVLNILKDIKNIEYFSLIEINSHGVILYAP